MFWAMTVLVASSGRDVKRLHAASPSRDHGFVRGSHKFAGSGG